MSEHRWEERAPRFAEDHMLTGKLVPMPSPSKAAWMLEAFLPGEGLALGSCPGSQAEGTTNLPTPIGLCQQGCLGPSSHGLFSTAAPWPPAPGLRPSTAGVKERQNTVTLGETQKGLQAMSSAWEASFPPSPSWQCSFWAHNKGPIINIADRKRGNQRQPYPRASIQEKIHYLRSLFFLIILDDNLGWYSEKIKGNKKVPQNHPVFSKI